MKQEPVDNHFVTPMSRILGTHGTLFLRRRIKLKISLAGRAVMVSPLLILLAAAQLLLPVEGFYFFLSKDVPRCFIEDVPHDMLVMGNYKVPRDAKDVVVFIVTEPAQG
eukprot:869106-Amorphochlora_amoeboformis.AAC.1